jgi:hypothetical protein
LIIGEGDTFWFRFDENLHIFLIHYDCTDVARRLSIQVSQSVLRDDDENSPKSVLGCLRMIVFNKSIKQTTLDPWILCLVVGGKLDTSQGIFDFDFDVGFITYDPWRRKGRTGCQG